MRSLPWIMWSGSLHLHLKYITQKYGLPHHQYSSHSQHSICIYRLNIFAKYAKTQPTAMSTSRHCQIYAKTNIPIELSICNKMEWVYSNTTGNTRFFLYLNTKQYFCLLVKICCLHSSKFIHNYQCSYSYTNVNVTVHNKSANINVTVHIKSAINVYKVVANIK